MAWTDGYKLISNTGTWSDFFSTVKSAVQENTGYNIINDDTSYSFTVDFGNGFTCAVSDSTITSESITTKSNSLKFVVYQNGVSRSNSTIAYSTTNYAQTENATRNIVFFTYANDNVKIFGIDQYSASASCISLTTRSFIECKYRNISTNEEKNLFKAYNYYLYDQGGNSFTWTTTFSKTSNGIILLNSLTLQGSIIDGYLPDIYNCTNVQPYSHYMINNQKYYSIDQNLLVKE